ncbi:MAG: hypothetical protein H6765_03380 [Candidatus Peribacteria bacterium]|nr:MAG: hypothetical protein H6765_03380 [Candidatus Peribacteria bacterium]
MAVAFISRGATVFSFNDASDQEMMKRACHLSDIIVSATGVLGLVDESFLAIDPGKQIIIDVGW